MNDRIEHDTLGEIGVPADRYWGAQTQRSKQDLGVDGQRMPSEVIHAFAILKKAAALANRDAGLLSARTCALIGQACDDIVGGHLHGEFPLILWQMGSGTQSNMNVNEVIARRAHVLAGGALSDATTLIHPTDDVNKSQSSNDMFPTAMRIAACLLIRQHTLPRVQALRDTLQRKSEQFGDIVKIGRLHGMEGAPLTLGRKLSGFRSQLDHGLRALRDSLGALAELAPGGTAADTGLDPPPGYAGNMARHIAELTGQPFVSAENRFEALTAHDAAVQASSALKRLAVSLMKIAGDVRVLACGASLGLAESVAPEGELGPSRMPGKANPALAEAEAMTMVCAQVMGNDVTIGVSGMSGQLQLDVFKPVIILNLLMSARLLGDACASFDRHCFAGLEPNRAAVVRHLEDSLMLVTALNPDINHDNAARITCKAHAENKTVCEAAIELGLLTDEQFSKWARARDLLGHRGRVVAR